MLTLSKEAKEEMQAEAWAEAKRIHLLRNSSYRRFQQKYFHDPVGFVHDCITWPRGKGPVGYQDESMSNVVEYKRECVRGPHNIGKTAEAAWLILWYALTRDGEDWKVPTTASAWRQLTKYLWPEVNKWSRMLNWGRIGRVPFDQRREQLTTSLKLSTGEAFAVASDEPAYIEGAHADFLLYVFDEAKTIPDETYDAAEGAFAGSGEDTAFEALAFSISTPGEPIGRFHAIQSRKSGYEDWHVSFVKKEQAIAAGRMSRAWADQRARQWGEGSAVYKNRVLGEFASQEEDSIIPLSWVEAAIGRWKDWRDEGFPGTFTGVGADIGLGGEHSDKTILATCYDHVKIKELRKFPRGDPDTATMEAAGRIKGILDANGGPTAPIKAYIDVIGIGAGVVHRLREQGYENAIAFNSAEGTEHRDESGEFGFNNKRSAGWWVTREMLNPLSKMGVCLPDDDDLIGELTTPKHRVLSGAKRAVQSKEKIKKTLKRSTDSGDAVVYILSGPTLIRLPEIEIVRLG